MYMYVWWSYLDELLRFVEFCCNSVMLVIMDVMEWEVFIVVDVIIVGVLLFMMSMFFCLLIFIILISRGMVNDFSYVFLFK